MYIALYIARRDTLGFFIFRGLHVLYSVQYTARTIPFMYSFSGKCAAWVPIYKFMSLWAIYIFPGLGRPILEMFKSLTDILYMSVGTAWETEHYKSVLKITVSFLWIHKWESDIYVGFSPALHLQCIGQICKEYFSKCNKKIKGENIKKYDTESFVQIFA